MVSKKKIVTHDYSSWILASRPRQKKNADKSISISFSVPKESDKTRCCLRIGNIILQEIKWLIGTEINALYNPNNKYEWMLVKYNNGYKLSKESNSPIGKISFNFSLGDPLVSQLTYCDFSVQKDRIILTIPKK